ncbi:MAG: GNAT family N-acetyltransferase [Magnetospirillum sp.]|nr:GNAT family N-acetyltransferase [Magnetospirillum sp.]
MEFRRAEDRDAADLLAWRNDPATIASSLTGKGVAAADHYPWLARILADSGYILMIAEQAGESLGMVRFDRDGDGSWEVGINLNPAARGRGLALAILAGAIEAAFAGRPRPPLTAQVRQSNPASWKIFQRCGFEVDRIEDCVGVFHLAPSCRVKGLVP